MRIRVRHVQLLALMTLFVVAAVAFLYLIGQDALQGRHPFQFFADSNTYLRIYTGEFDTFDGALIGVATNYVGPLLVLELLRGNVYLVMLLNVAIFCASLLQIATLLRVDPLKVAALLLLSPLTVSSLLSVNKEIFAFPFIALALTGYMRRSVPAIVLALIASMLARWQLTGFYVVMLLIGHGPRWFSRRTVLLGLLAGASAFYALMQDWLEPIISATELAIAEYDEGGSGLFEATLNYQKQGLYFLLFPVKAAHLLFGLGLRFDKWLSPADIYNDIFVAGHCLVSLVALVALLARKQFSLSSDMIFTSMVFLAIICLSPVFAPRYLYPVYVLWVLILAGARADLVSSQFRARRHRRAQTSSTNAPAAALPATSLGGALHYANDN